jgi:hypothetical protein
LEEAIGNWVGKGREEAQDTYGPRLEGEWEMRVFLVVCPYLRHILLPSVSVDGSQNHHCRTASFVSPKFSDLPFAPPLRKPQEKLIDGWGRLTRSGKRRDFVGGSDLELLNPPSLIHSKTKQLDDDEDKW